MNKFLSAAKRDALGIMHLYLHLFFKRKWFKAHGDMGTAFLYRIFPWGLGLSMPVFFGSAVMQSAQQNGLLAGVGTGLALLFLVWLAYRSYRVFRPENSASAGSHVRGAEIDDLSGGGDAK